MLRCDLCGAVFATPCTVAEGFGDHRGWCRESAAVCPRCGGGRFQRVYACGGRSKTCLGWSDRGLCAPCRQELWERCRAFFGEMSPGERETVDAWLEGIGVGVFAGDGPV